MKIRWLLLFSFLLIGCSSNADNGIAEVQESVDETNFDITVPEHEDYSILSAYIESATGLEVLHINYGIATSDEPSTEIDELAEEHDIDTAAETIYGTYDGETSILMQIYTGETQAANQEERTELTIEDELVYENDSDHNVTHQMNLNGNGYLILYMDEDATEEEREAFTRSVIEDNQ